MQQLAALTAAVDSDEQSVWMPALDRIERFADEMAAALVEIAAVLNRISCRRACAELPHLEPCLRCRLVARLDELDRRIGGDQ